MSAKITKITNIGFVSNESQTTLLCTLHSHFYSCTKEMCCCVNADFSFYSWWRLKTKLLQETHSTSSLAERRKKPFVPMKTEQNGSKCDNQSSKRQSERERKRDISPFWRQTRGERWHLGWSGSDEEPRGEERLMKWLQDRENTRRRGWMLETWVCGSNMLCNHRTPHFPLFTT